MFESNLCNIIVSKQFYFYHQLDAMDCGPTCLRMVAKYYKKNIFALQKRDKKISRRIKISHILQILTINYRTSMKPNRKSNIKPDIFGLGRTTSLGDAPPWCATDRWRGQLIDRWRQLEKLSLPKMFTK